MLGVLENMKMARGMRDSVSDHPNEENPFGALEAAGKITGERHNESLIRNLVTEFRFGSCRRKIEECAVNPSLRASRLSGLG
jgi:hypothetical protein